MADDIKPAGTTSRPSPAKTNWVFVDYLGAPDREGHRRPGHRIAPICAGSDGGKLPRIAIRPGLTVQERPKWSAHCPKLKDGAKAKAKAGVIRGLVDDGHLVVLEGLPTDASALLAIAARTQCPDALQVLIDHERGRKSDENGKNPRPRKAVLAELEARKATVDRRAKSPVAPGDKRRLAAQAKPRVLH